MPALSSLPDVAPFPLQGYNTAFDRKEVISHLSAIKRWHTRKENYVLKRGYINSKKFNQNLHCHVNKYETLKTKIIHTCIWSVLSSSLSTHSYVCYSCCILIFLACIVARFKLSCNCCLFGHVYCCSCLVCIVVISCMYVVLCVHCCFLL